MEQPKNKRIRRIRAELEADTPAARCMARSWEKYYKSVIDAYNLKRKGISDDIIAECTSLAIEKVAKLN